MRSIIARVVFFVSWVCLGLLLNFGFSTYREINNPIASFLTMAVPYLAYTYFVAKFHKFILKW